MLGLPPLGALAVVLGLVGLTFVPILCVHPFRVARLRLVTGLVALVWALVVVVAVASPFPSALWVKITLLAAAAYFALVGLSQTLRRVL